MTDELENNFFFPTSVYSISKPELFDDISDVYEETIKIAKQEQKLDDIYPCYMSSSFQDHPSAKKFASYVGSTAWNILESQGYDMENNLVFFSSMWGQEHYKHSSMEQHVHGYGTQLVGFYFLEAPEECSAVVFHDPRPGKPMSDLPEKNNTQVSYASSSVYFVPKPGMLMIANSWLPHSFSKHGSDKPLKFIHFNINVAPNVNNQQSLNITSDSLVEVI